MNIFDKPIRIKYTKHVKRLDKITSKLTKLENDCWLYDGITICVPDYPIKKYQHVPHRALHILLINDIPETSTYSSKYCTTINCCNPTHYILNTKRNIHRMQSSLTDITTIEALKMYAEGYKISDIAYKLSAKYHHVYDLLKP